MSGDNLLGVDRVLAELATIRQELHPVLADQVDAVTREAMYSARAAAPVRTGTLVNAIQMVKFDQGLTGVVFVAPREDPNYNGGWLEKKGGRLTARQRRRPPQFPLWIEYGTARWRGQPFLMPTFRAMVGRFSSSCAAVARRLVEGT